MYANNLDDAFSVFASGTTEEWVKSDKYMDYPKYHDDDYTYIEGRTIGDIAAQISVQGEAYSQYISFMMDRYYDGIDLMGMSIWIHYELKDGSGSEDSPVNVMYNDSTIRFNWIIPEKATQQSGDIKIGVWVNGTAPNTKAYILKTEEKIYTIHPGLIPGSGITQPDQNWFENFVEQMDSKVSTAQGHANDAKASKTAAVGSAAASAQSATASAQALADNKAYVESQKAAFVGYNKRETDLKYSNALIGLAAGTMHVTVDDAWEAPIPGLEIAGKSEQGAEPSTDNPQEIVSTDVTAVTVTGANLFDDTTLHPGKTTVVFSDDRRQLTVTGSKSHACAYSDIPAQLIAGKNVTMSCNISNGNPDISVGFQIQIKFPDGTITYLTLKSSGSKTCSIPENITNATFTLYANDRNTDLDSKNTVVYSDVMVNIGTTPLPWEPYQPPQTASITLTEPLRGIGDVRDRIMCKDGVWGVERKIVPLILNGSETWNQFNTSGSKSFGVADFDSLIKIGSALLCDRLSEDKADNVWNGVRDNIIAYSYSSPRHLRIFLNSTATLDTLKALLSADPMHVIAERKSPTWEPLPADTQAALNALTAYKGRTTITVTAEGPEPDVAVEYVQDTNVVIAELKKLIEGIQNVES